MLDAPSQSPLSQGTTFYIQRMIGMNKGKEMPMVVVLLLLLLLCVLFGIAIREWEQAAKNIEDDETKEGNCRSDNAEEPEGPSSPPDGIAHQESEAATKPRRERSHAAEYLEQHEVQA